MKKTNKGFKEWAGVVEALGQGLQTIIIRKNKTAAKGFLFYPSYAYSLKKDYLQMFKEKFRPFVKNNTPPYEQRDRVELKYFAEVVSIHKISPRKISELDKYHIWQKNHVKSYLDDNKGYVWLIRTYNLNKPYIVEQNRGMRFVNLRKDISLSNKTPTMNDEEFFKISDHIINIIS